MELLHTDLEDVFVRIMQDQSTPEAVAR